MAEGYKEQDASFATRTIHVGQEPEQWQSGAVVVPISLATTFKQEVPDEFSMYEYSRYSNPTRNALEKVLASLEAAKYGLTFSSGLAAVSSIAQLLSSGDHIVAMDDLYGGTSNYLKQMAARMNIRTTFVDATNPENVKNAIEDNTRMVWIETPTNPTLKIVDIRQVADIVHQRDNIFLAVDNTFLSSYFQRPLELGADVVMHSLSKYINGHSDVIMGAAMTNADELHGRLRYIQGTGPVPSPFDCYLVNRGLKTLPVRMRQHMKNGLAVARFLENHPSVERVLHPGLTSHPQHQLALRQCYGHSGMVSFYIKGGKREAVNFLNFVKVFTSATSLGGVESLAQIPAVRTHVSLTPEERQRCGITNNLIRLSVGLEDVGDIIADLDQALRAAVNA